MNVLQPLVERGDIRIVYDQFASRWTEEEGYRLMKECLELNQQVDAVIAGNDNLVTGASEGNPGERNRAHHIYCGTGCRTYWHASVLSEVNKP